MAPPGSGWMPSVTGTCPLYENKCDMVAGICCLYGQKYNMSADGDHSIASKVSPRNVTLICGGGYIGNIEHICKSYCMEHTETLRHMKRLLLQRKGVKFLCAFYNINNTCKSVRSYLGCVGDGQADAQVMNSQLKEERAEGLSWGLLDAWQLVHHLLGSHVDVLIEGQTLLIPVVIRRFVIQPEEDRCKTHRWVDGAYVIRV